MANSHGVLKLLLADKRVPKRLKTFQQAERIAWRIILQWVELSKDWRFTFSGDLVQWVDNRGRDQTWSTDGIQDRVTRAKLKIAKAGN